MPVVTTAALKALFQLRHQLMALFGKRVMPSGGSFHTALAIGRYDFQMDLCLCHRYSLVLSNWALLNYSHRSPPLLPCELNDI
jgi:hypothetical protein